MRRFSETYEAKLNSGIKRKFEKGDLCPRRLVKQAEKDRVLAPASDDEGTESAAKVSKGA